MGNFCRNHSIAATQLYPQSTREETAAAYNGGDPEVKELIDSAVENIKSGSNACFDLPSDVMTESIQGIRICFELGFVSEAELFRLCGATGKALGLKPVTMALEQRTITTSGYVLSLRGLDYGEIMSMRRLQIYRNSQVVLKEHNLEAPAMIHEKQPSIIYDWLCGNACSGLPGYMKASVGARSQPPSVDELKIKAQQQQDSSVVLFIVEEVEEAA